MSLDGSMLYISRMVGKREDDWGFIAGFGHQSHLLFMSETHSESETGVEKGSLSTN